MSFRNVNEISTNNILKPLFREKGFLFFTAATQLPKTSAHPSNAIVHSFFAITHPSPKNHSCLRRKEEEGIIAHRPLDSFARCCVIGGDWAQPQGGGEGGDCDAIHLFRCSPARTPKCERQRAFSTFAQPSCRDTAGREHPIRTAAARLPKRDNQHRHSRHRPKQSIRSADQALRPPLARNENGAKRERPK